MELGLHVFGKRIKEARKKLGYTQKQVAELLGLSTGTIQQYELGKRRPKPDTFLELCAVLGMNDMELMELTDIAYFERRQIGKALERFLAKHSNDIDQQYIQQIPSAPQSPKTQIDSIVEHANLLNFEGLQRLDNYAEDLAKIPEYQRKEEDN